MFVWGKAYNGAFYRVFRGGRDLFDPYAQDNLEVKKVSAPSKNPMKCPIICVPDPGKGVCVDPVNGGAILGKGGPDPQSGNKERQLSPEGKREDVIE